MVTPGSMRSRVVNHETGRPDKCRNPTNNDSQTLQPKEEAPIPESKKKQSSLYVVENGIVYDGPMFGNLAIMQLVSTLFHL